MSLPFEPHFLVFAAEGTDEPLRMVTAIHYRATRHARDHYRRVRSCVSAGIAPLLINNVVRYSPLVVPDDYRALDSYRHISFTLPAPLLLNHLSVFIAKKRARG